jgi:hypothetical protein
MVFLFVIASKAKQSQATLQPVEKVLIESPKTRDVQKFQVSGSQLSC